MGGTDPEWVKLAVDIGQFVLLGAVGLHQWLIAKDRVRGQEIRDLSKEMDSRLDVAVSRLDQIEVRVNHLPARELCSAEMSRVSKLEEAQRHAVTMQDVARIYTRMDALAARLNEINGGMRRLERLLDVLHEHLLEEKK